mmetsp:Transcript_14497/g.14585  ORF Transcript_14497/g.14585 Transcript_14497/m.14585 type:complete len:490 (+) Transcript_14497:120-1589(+)
MEQEVKDEDSRKQADNARKIAPIRKKGNLLLCTLIIGTVGAGSALSIVMSDIEGSLEGFFISTSIIVIFGEIIPQAICGRYGLIIGAKVVWLVRCLIVLEYIIAKPISVVLDYMLGDDPGTKFTKAQMKALFNIYEREARLNPEQQKILTSAMDFSETKLSAIMTPLDNAFMLNSAKTLNIEKIKKIYDKGYSRIPVYEGKRENIIGVLMAKDLMFVSIDKFIKMWGSNCIFIRPIMTVNLEVPVEDLLKDFKAGKSHIAVVQEVVVDGGRDPYYSPVGIITMEDIIETLIQQEIEDEHDINRLKAKTNKLHKVSSAVLFSIFPSKSVMTETELDVIKTFLAKNIEPFRSDRISSKNLTKLISKARIIMMNGDENEETINIEDIKYESDNSVSNSMDGDQKPDDGLPRRILCQKGMACSFFYLVLSGQVELKIGNEGITSEAGPYHCLGVKALNEPMNLYVPDYTAKVNKPTRILRISQQLYMKYASRS